MAETDRGPGDGHWPLSDPKATQIISEEYYKNRQSDLALYNICMPDVRISLKALLPLQSPAKSSYLPKEKRLTDKPGIVSAEALLAQRARPDGRGNRNGQLSS